MADTDNAFPMHVTERDGHRYVEGLPGLTKTEYAAIHLRVPRSGNAELDDMIRESQRFDLAKAAMQGALANPNLFDVSSVDGARIAFEDADAMLAELDKDAGR